MKRTKIFVTVLLVSTVFLMNGCSKKEKTTDNCVTLSVKLSNAYSAFAANQTQATCEAYVQAIDNYLNGCDLIDAVTRAEYEDWRDSENCSDF